MDLRHRPDIYFTYNNIIKENSWNISGLDAYKNIVITKIDEENIQVTFSKPSIDNKIFFINYILPNHILKESSIDDYITIYRNNKNAIFNNCASLQFNSLDTNSVVFDLTNCSRSFIKYYQVKKYS